VLSESDVSPFLRVDLSAAQGGVEAEEILHGFQVRGVKPFVETASPSAGLVGDL